MLAVVGQVFAVDAVGDDEDLDVLEEAVGATVGVSLVAVGLVEGFFEFESSPLEFDLYERKSIYQNRDVVAIFVATFHRDLVGDLVLVSASVALVDEFDVDVFAVVSF